MSLNHSPSIATNGLVMCYDMSNTGKSWKGQPTTNYVANANTMAGWNNYSNTANGTPAQFLTEFGTTGYRMDNVGSWNGVYKSVTVPSTGTYTFSAWIKWIGGSSNVTGGAVYISGWGGADSATATNRTLPGQWQRISITLNCTTTSMTFYLISWGGTNNADNCSWQVTMPQIESGSYVTPFVNGTRTNTQAIVDLTGNNTFTASSLTYASDNTFSFNGSTGVIYGGASSNYLPMPNFTLESWHYCNGVAPGMNTSSPWGLTYGITGNIYSDGSTAYNTYNSDTSSTFSSVGSSGVNLIGAWHHVVYVVGTTTSQLYIDGKLNATASNSGTWSGTNTWSAMALQIGNNPNDAYYKFNGKIPVAKIYNKALSAAEVQQNFNALRGRYGI
jgi:hypothetical protein